MANGANVLLRTVLEIDGGWLVYAVSSYGTDLVLV